MKLHGLIDVAHPGEPLLRNPNVWDRIRKAFGGEPDLRTGALRTALEATAVVDASRRAFARLGVTNAISLVVDDQVLFQDHEGKPDDLGDLFLAFHDNASVFGGGFRILRLAAEHEEAGLHLVLEVVARTEHPAGEPAARVVVAGRLRDLEPKQGEDADAYRARAEPITRDAPRLALHRAQFESFVARAADVLRAAMPEAQVSVRSAEAQVERPARRPRRAAAPAPTDPRYDPMERYYPHPLGGVLSFMMWSSILHMAVPPPVVVYADDGARLGDASDVAHGDGGDEGGGGDLDGDGGGGDFDGGGGDFDGGGDFGGDFGGGDFGGGDF